MRQNAWKKSWFWTKRLDPQGCSALRVISSHAVANLFRQEKLERKGPFIYIIVNMNFYQLLAKKWL